MQHPYATITGFVDEPLDGWRGPWGQNGYSLEFYPSDPARGFVRGTKWNLMPVGGPLFHHDLVVGGTDRPWDEAWGAGFHRDLARTFGRGFTWGIQGDDLPDAANQVTLDRRPPTRTACPARDPLHGQREQPQDARLEPRAGARGDGRDRRHGDRTRCRCGGPASATCWARRGWATTRRRASWTAGAAPTTCPTCS